MKIALPTIIIALACTLFSGVAIYALAGRDIVAQVVSDPTLRWIDAFAYLSWCFGLLGYLAWSRRDTIFRDTRRSSPNYAAQIFFGATDLHAAEWQRLAEERKREVAAQNGTGSAG